MYRALAFTALIGAESTDISSSAADSAAAAFRRARALLSAALSARPSPALSMLLRCSLSRASSSSYGPVRGVGLSI